MSFTLKLENIKTLSKVYFHQPSRQTNNSMINFRRYYHQPRCVVDYNTKTGHGYFGSFCALERCVNPFCDCKNCSYNIQY